MRISLNGSDWRVLGLPPSEWVWRKVGDPGVDLDHLQPAAQSWIPAVVPGDVQSDLRDAGQLPDFTIDLNSRACEWASNRDWVYRKEFWVEAEHHWKQAVLRFESVDYACHVFLNGRKLGEHTGTYTPFELDATEAIDWAGANRLIVVVEHAPTEPEVQGQIAWTNTIRRWKPRFAYGWDWCTRMVPLGIIDDVSLILCDEARIFDVWVRPSLEWEDEVPEATPSGAAEVVIEYDVTREIEGVELLTVYGPDGELEAGPYDFPVRLTPSDDPSVSTIHFDQPRLWWPNGLGDQPLYRLHVALNSMDGRLLDESIVRFGFRQIRAIANDGAPPDALPYLLEVNGVRTFIRGWNWAPIDQLYGREHEKQYRHAIRMAREANCNLLRVWGGGLLERELFYNLCDEAGIMVWQEFFQSSSGIDNEPASDPEYVAYVRDQAHQIVPRRRNHPSLVIWCGGNELMTPDMTPIGNDHPAIAPLREAVAEFHPGAIFLPTSPSGPKFAADPSNIGQMHDVHGHWLWMGDPGHYAFYNGIDPLLHSEYGVEGAANIEALRRFISADLQWPPDASNPVWVQHGAWWLNREKVEALFGPIDNLDDFVNASQLLQFEGLRYAVESSVRRQFRTSGSMPWQFNESWPNASCTNSLDYYGHAKPAYWAMANGYSPLLVSARYDRLAHRPGDELRAEIWLSTYRKIGDGVSLEWHVTDLLGDSVISPSPATLAVPDIATPGSVRLTEVGLRLPDKPSVFALDLKVTGPDAALHAANTYLFSTFDRPAMSELLRLPKARIDARFVPGPDARISVTAAGGMLFGVRVSPVGDYAGPYVSQGYAVRIPSGRTQEITVRETGRVRVSAWNAEAVEVEVG